MPVTDTAALLPFTAAAHFRGNQSLLCCKSESEYMTTRLIKTNTLITPVGLDIIDNLLKSTHYSLLSEGSIA